MIEKELSLELIAKNKKIDELNSEDILKLMSFPYLEKEITKAFNITEKDFKDIKIRNGIKNSVLENIIRDIETILNYIDLKNIYVSNMIRSKIVKILIQSFTNNLPKKNFYINELTKTNFSREKIKNDLDSKKIDQEYRLNQLLDIIPDVGKTVEKLLKEEKDFLLHFNNRKIYNQMLNEKEKGKIFKKEDLDKDLMYELAIIENIPDSLIADLFDMNKTQIRYLRQKMGFSMKFDLKLQKHPEAIIYYMEEKNERIPGVSNYEYEKMANKLKEFYKKDLRENQKEKLEITLDIDGTTKKYNVTFSDEKYSANSKTKRESKGSHHNYKKENETKRTHGIIGEQIALEAEKERLKKLGLHHLINDVKLISQVDENITFDGLGYDLISFNEQQEKICIEVKTSFGKKDKAFFISKKEIELIQGIKEEYDCKHYLIYYVLIDNNDVVIKTIYSDEFSNFKLTPILYKVESSNL